MPMRGLLPSVRRPSRERKKIATLQQALLVAYRSEDFLAVSAFSTVGLYASLYFGLAHPQILALVASSTLSP